MAELAKIAIGAGCLHNPWLVLRENVAATGFYESIGGAIRLRKELTETVRDRRALALGRATAATDSTDPGD